MFKRLMTMQQQNINAYLQHFQKVLDRWGTISGFSPCPLVIRGAVMNIQRSILLSAVSALFWVGTAAAATVSSSPSNNSGALFASVMQNPAPAEETETNESPLAPNLQRQVVNYPTAVVAGTIVIDTAHTYLYYVLGD